MVAIATIADAVPLVGENRVFAKLGLEGLRKPVNAGLRALLANCQLDGSRPLSAGDIAFRVAPRLNAAGRMDVAERVIQLFTEKDAAKAAEMAMQLNQLNGDRQQEEQRILEEIQQQDRIVARDERRLLPGGGWRGLASRRHRHLRHAHRRALSPSDADLLLRRRRSARLGPLDRGVSFAGSAGIVSGAVHPLWRTLPRCGMCASGGADSRVAFAAGCLCAASG